MFLEIWEACERRRAFTTIHGHNKPIPECGQCHSATFSVHKCALSAKGFQWLSKPRLGLDGCKKQIAELQNNHIKIDKLTNHRRCGNALVVSCAKTQDFRKLRLIPPHQGVRVSEIYDRNRPPKQTPGLRPRQHLRPDTHAQLDQLQAEGCTKVYREKASGAQADRRELLKMLKELAAGDTVMVTRIDRLARSTFDLFAIVKKIVDAGGQFRSLAEPWADTSTSTGRLMIAVLGGLADVERDLIRTRTAEGRSRAKGRGQHMGRPPKLTPRSRRRRAAPRRGATLRELARS